MPVAPILPRRSWGRIVPAYGATGVGQAIASGTAAYNHTLLSTDTAILAWVVGILGWGIPTVGGVPMINLTGGAGSLGPYASISFSVYGLIRPPTGLRSIGVTACTDVAVNSISYGNVGAFGQALSATGATSFYSHACVTNQPVAQAFTMFSGLGGISAYTQSQRFYIPQEVSSNAPIIGGDSATPNPTFAATGYPGENWASLAIPLFPPEFWAA